MRLGVWFGLVVWPVAPTGIFIVEYEFPVATDLCCAILMPFLVFVLLRFFCKQETGKHKCETPVFFFASSGYYGRAKPFKVATPIFSNVSFLL